MNYKRTLRGAAILGIIAALAITGPGASPAKDDEPKNFVLPLLLPVEPKPIAAGFLPEKKLEHRALPIDLGGQSRILEGLRIGVTAPVYDDMGRLLRKLGDGYRYAAVSEFDLANAKKLAQFEVIFVTCENTKLTPEIIAAIKDYVAEGGTLYASDLRFDLLAAAFPGIIDQRHVATGLGPQDVTADVVEAGLRPILGKTMPLHFKTNGWRSAAFDSTRAQVYLAGSFRTLSGATQSAPLMCRFRYYDGHVFFTSFHNAAQNSEAELKLLQYTVFATVNAQIDDRLQALLKADGFDTRDVKTLNTSEGVTLARQSFEHAKKGKLRVALGFRKGSARLQLDVITPAGARITHADARCFVLEIDDAPAGTWQYSVTGVSVPFSNFPYTIMVAE